MMKKVAIYMRCSTNKQDLEMQKRHILDWLDNHQKQSDLKIRWFTDAGCSGKNMNRPGMIELLKCVGSRQVDHVICYRLDRLSRNAITAIKLVMDMASQNIGFVATDQPILNLGNDNPFRHTMVAAFAEIAQIERETTVARVRAGLEAAKRRGKKLGRPEVISRDDIRRAAQAYLDKKGSLRAIAKQFNVSHNTVRKAVVSLQSENSIAQKKAANAKLI